MGVAEQEGIMQLCNLLCFSCQRGWRAEILVLSFSRKMNGASKRILRQQIFGFSTL